MTRRLIASFIVILLITSLTIIYAGVPGSINYQGRLTDNLDSPVPDSTYEMAFKIYGSEAGTDELWSSGPVDVLVINGLFNVKLGSSPMISFPDDLFSSGISRYLGITIGIEPELTPRTLLTSGAYTFHALHADTADYALAAAGVGNSGWTDDGSTTRLSNSNDSVGIGTDNPAAKLHLVTPGGEVKLGQSSNSVYGQHFSGSYGYLAGSNIGVYGYSNSLNGVQGSTFSGYGVRGGTSDASGFGIYGENINGPYGYLGGADYAVYGNSGSGFAGYFAGKLYAGGYAGFGVTPLTKLHVSGGNWDLASTPGDFLIGNATYGLKMGISAGGGGAGDARIRSHGGTDRLILGSGTSDMLIIDSAGVGVNTFTPIAKLHVYGDIHVEGTSRDISWKSGEHLQIGDLNGTTFTERLRLTSDGKMGIGTTNPQDKLEVNGHIRMDQGTGNGNFLRFAENGSMKWTFLHKPWATSTFVLRDEVGAINVMSFKPSTGYVGIGTDDPRATLEVDGDLIVTGVVKGDLGPNNGGPIARPAYDSGWQTIAPGETLTLTHNVGVDVNKYLVDIQFNCPELGISNYRSGGDFGPSGTYGAYWRNLTTTTIKVYRYPDDWLISQVKIRIWMFN
jgi:hypothetical protein